MLASLCVLYPFVSRVCCPSTFYFLAGVYSFFSFFFTFLLFFFLLLF